MMQLVTKAIILSRTDYGEADRILTVLTPDHGKLRLMAKGVRRVKSRLAGGIELFSVSTITFVRGRGEIGTLVSTRLIKHYGTIVQDLDRTMAGYELIKRLNKITEDDVEASYFKLLEQAFEALDDATIALPIIPMWFWAQLLMMGGHTPNLRTDANGLRLESGQQYRFDIERMCFEPAPDRGQFTEGHIKFLRLIFLGHTPKTLLQVQGGAALTTTCTLLVQEMTRYHF